MDTRYLSAATARSATMISPPGREDRLLNSLLCTSEQLLHLTWGWYNSGSAARARSFVDGEVQVSEVERATRQSWPNIKSLPAQQAELPVVRNFTQQEYDRIRLGFIPERMEDKWFMFVEDDTLYIHRSWTGYCIYQVTLVRDDTNYTVSRTLVNRDENQYSGGYDEYDEKLLLFLIDHLLLKETLPMPMTSNITAGIATELYHHHVLGAGQRADAPTIQPTIRGMLGWLGRWLVWLIKR